jgi:uncharacterized protein (DUF488 family)
MNPKIYTIGYSGYTLPDFINELKALQITALIDVRSVPFSKRYPDFNKEKLAITLRENGIIYRSYAKEFGARRTERELYTDGKVDFVKVAACENFKSGVEKIIAGADLGYVFALMCAERDPAVCHRAVLVSRAFSERGFNVSHILRGAGELPQIEFERRLVDFYFPQPEQVLFSAQELTAKEKLCAAYARRGGEIAVALHSANYPIKTAN